MEKKYEIFKDSFEEILKRKVYRILFVIMLLYVIMLLFVVMLKFLAML